MPLPDGMSPAELASKYHWSERTVRSTARRLGACLIMGKTMTLLPKHVEAIKNGIPLPPKRISADRKECAVYFVAVRGFIKIGWSEDWRSRMSHMQTSNPEPIEVLLVIGRPKIYEKTMHRKFAPFKARGEWFRDCAAIREYISEREGECWYRARRLK